MYHSHGSYGIDTNGTKKKNITRISATIFQQRAIGYPGLLGFSSDGFCATCCGRHGGKDASQSSCWMTEIPPAKCRVAVCNGDFGYSKEDERAHVCFPENTGPEKRKIKFQP